MAPMARLSGKAQSQSPYSSMRSLVAASSARIRAGLERRLTALVGRRVAREMRRCMRIMVLSEGGRGMWGYPWVWALMVSSTMRRSTTLTSCQAARMRA